MKRLFFVVLAVILMLCLPCMAEDVMVEADVVDGELAEGDMAVGGSVKDWITAAYEWVMAHWDDIMAVILFIAAMVYKLGTSVINKKILPKIEKQGETVAAMASAAGKLTQDNKVNFEASLENSRNNFDNIIAEVRAVLAEGGERETNLIAALKTAVDTKEEYRLLCDKYDERNDKIVAALMAQEQMIYDTLMSAKLTDARKAAIEARHLENVERYAALAAGTGGEADAE